MKKQSLQERFQQLAGIKPLYEVNWKKEGEDRSEFKWVDQNDQKIPYFKAYQGISNYPKNKLENLIKAYGEKVMDPSNPDYHNPEKLWGDKLVSFFKDFYLKWADGIGNAEIRRKLQNPTKEDEDKYIDQGALVDAVNYIKSLPTIKGHQYLINDPKFSDILENVRGMLDMWVDPQGGNYYPNLAPLLITYTLKMFKDHVWDKPLGREFRNTK